MSVIYIEDNDKNKTTNDYKDNDMDNNMDMDNDNNNESNIFMSLIQFNVNLFQHSCY